MSKLDLCGMLGVVACGALDETDVGEAERAVGGSGLVINEFKGGTSGWIEIHNPGAAAADVTGWSVDDIAGGGGAPKSLGTTSVPARGYFVVTYSKINVASADSVRLLDAAGAEADAHSNFYGGASVSGLCFGRRPDGGAWAATSLVCSQAASNGGAGWLLRGTVVTPAAFFAGEVLVAGDMILCADVSCASHAGAAGAAIVETGGLIFPGMIDTHNHILFDVFDETDWSPPRAYTNHNQWTQDDRYGAMVDAKQYLNGEGGSPVNVGCEMNKYGELKGLVAGTTSIVGAANPTNKSCYASLARTIDQTPNDMGADRVQVATIFPGASSADGVCNNIATGSTDAYLIHVGEGTDATALAEFARLGTVTTSDECLYAPMTTIVHGTALGEAEFDVMAENGMGLVWSPRSNVFLYGGGTDLAKTTNVPLARAKGLNVALAPDWSIGGSQNLLDELRFADEVDGAVWGDVLSPKDLVEMVTINAARAIGLEGALGSIEAGKKADLFMIDGDPAAPYDALLAATPADVRLVMVGGVALYGDTAMQWLAPAAPACDALDLCGAAKFACVAEAGGTATNKLGQTHADIVAALTTALADHDARNLSAWDFSPVAPLVRCP